MTESCLVTRLTRYMELTPRERRFLATMEGDERSLKAGQPVISQGTPSDGLFVLKTGWAIVRSQPVRGRSAILRVYLPGEVIGLGEIGPPAAPHAILMQTDGVVCPFPRHALGAMAVELPRLGALLTALASVDQITLRDQCATLGLMSAEDRLIHFLLSLRARLCVANSDMEDHFQLPFSQTEIGEAVGMTSVYVNKLLRKLAAEKRIQVSRPFIRLLDRRGLENQTGFFDRFTEIDRTWFPPPV